jgi:hypothetical protein
MPATASWTETDPATALRSSDPERRGRSSATAAVAPPVTKIGPAKSSVSEPNTFDWSWHEAPSRPARTQRPPPSSAAGVRGPEEVDMSRDELRDRDRRLARDPTGEGAVLIILCNPAGAGSGRAA